MPVSKKVTWAQLRVGIVSAAALSLLAVVTFLITGETTFFRKEAKLYTHLSDSAAMAKGAPVRLNGVLIGRLAQIGLSRDKDPRRTIRLEMLVDEGMLQQIPVDSVVAVSAENVLGSKFLNIRKGQSGETVKPGGELQSLDTSDFDDVVASGYAVMNSAQGMLKRIDRILTTVESGEGSIGKLIKDEQLYKNLVGTTSEAHKMMQSVNSGEGTLGRLVRDEALYDDVRRTIARMDSLLAEVQQGQGTAGRLLKDPALYDDLRKTVGEMRTLVADLNAGKGTAGKLLKDEELHKQIVSTVARMDRLLERINTGEGTLGQLVVNPQLYENLNGMTREMEAFMKDFRANPKKFLSIKLGLF